jgi:tRNA A37 threonylcarbamoyladenosine modification protein TsaB
MLMLAVEASGSNYQIGLGEPGSPPTIRTTSRLSDGFDGIPGLAAELLDAAGAKFSDLSRLAVDVGPGGLIAVRSAVSYCNALGFALGIPIFSASSFEVMTQEVRQTTDQTIVGVLPDRSEPGMAIFSICPGSVGEIKFRRGPLRATLTSIGEEFGAVALVGSTGSKSDTDLSFSLVAPNLVSLFTLASNFSGIATSVPVHALTSDSKVFHHEQIA